MTVDPAYLRLVADYDQTLETLVDWFKEFEPDMQEFVRRLERVANATGSTVTVRNTARLALGMLLHLKLLTDKREAECGDTSTGTGPEQ